MFYPHPISQVCTDNTTSSEIDNYTIKQQQSRAMNMRFFGFVTKKPKKNSLHGKQDIKTLQTIKKEHHSTKYCHRLRTIYLPIDKTPW